MLFVFITDAVSYWVGSRPEVLHVSSWRHDAANIAALRKKAHMPR